MIINLKTNAAKAEQQEANIELRERLPAHVLSPCMIHCQFDVEAFNHYYVITLDVNSTLSVICQRCLKEFAYHYVNQTTLAICDSDEMAEKLMEQYECIVSNNNQVDLKELLTDELHLYVPESHPEITDCDNEIDRFITSDNTIKL